jgi:hypothetical protein
VSDFSHTRPDKEGHNDSNSSARRSRFQSDPARRIDWKPFPAFPPPVRLAVLVGDPSKPGPYLIRVKAPSGVKLMPHRHPEDRLYTVMSGVFYIGLGEHFDGDKVQAHPPGSVIVLPGGAESGHTAAAPSPAMNSRRFTR